METAFVTAHKAVGPLGSPSVRIGSALMVVGRRRVHRARVRVRHDRTLDLIYLATAVFVVGAALALKGLTEKTG